jgi:hypothetical protein
MNVVKMLAAGVLGVTLIALGFEITNARPFETLYAVGKNPAWGFGPRELAHCVGFAGCTLGGWALVRSFGSRRGRRMNLIASIAGLCLLPLFLKWPEWMPFTIDHGIRKFVCTIGIPFYFLGTLMMLQYVKDYAVLTKPMPAALMSAVGMLLWSIFWEVGVQPLESVYGGPPRGYIQWAQLISDFIGIWTPAIALVLCAGEDCIVHLPPRTLRHSA